MPFRKLLHALEMSGLAGAELLEVVLLIQAGLTKYTKSHSVGRRAGELMQGPLADRLMRLARDDNAALNRSGCSAEALCRCLNVKADHANAIHSRSKTCQMCLFIVILRLLPHSESGHVPSSQGRYEKSP